MQQKHQNPNIVGMTNPYKELELKHTHNYLSSMSRAKRVRKLEESDQSVILTKPGQARNVVMRSVSKANKAGIFSQHNSAGAFKNELEILESITYESYKDLIDAHELMKRSWQKKSTALTKKRVAEIADKFANLSPSAFRQMMGLSAAPNKRDFEFYYLKENNITHTAYLHERNELTIFIQSIFYNKDGSVQRLLHCMFDKGEPFVINESRVDKFGNIRQISHVGKKGGSNIKNSLERFDDGTVIWTVSDGTKTGSAALKINGEIVLLGGVLNSMNMIAARNLGAEGLNKNNVWDGKFSLAACKSEDHPLQREYKDSVRKQIYNIIDGSSIPGLKPIFVV